MRISKNTLSGGLLLAAIISAAVPVGGTAGASTGGGPVPAASSEAGTLDCSQLESLWEEAGGSPSAAFIAAEIATAESSGHEYATDADGNGTTDEGYWQINTSHGSLATYDPLGNAKAAVEISSDGTNWSPWVTYQTGAYAGQC
jgi:hypothetical protein